MANSAFTIPSAGIGDISSASGTITILNPTGPATNIDISSYTPNTLAGFNNSGSFSDVSIGSGITLSGGVLNASGAVSSVSNADGSLTISPHTGAIVASLNVANPNTWGAVQTFDSGDLIATTVSGPASTSLALQAGGFTQAVAGYIGNGTNYWVMGGSSSGASLQLYSTGTDASIPLVIESKGPSGAINLATNGLTNIQAQIVNTANAVDYLTLTGGISGSPGVCTIGATGSDANVSLNLTTKGSGTVTINGSPISGSGTVNSGTTGEIAYYATSGSAISGNANLTVTGAGVLTSTGLVANPPSGTINQALSITQTGPSSGSVAGPLYYNHFVFNDDVDVTGIAAPSSLIIAGGWGFRLDFHTGGSNAAGQKSGMMILMDNNVNADSGGDYIGITALAQSNVTESSDAEFYGMNPQGIILGSGNVTGVHGMEIDCGIYTGGVAGQRTGMNISNIGEVVGTSTTEDSAISLRSTAAAGSFKNGIVLSTIYGAAPIQTNGNLIYSTSAMTIANAVNMANVTVTGDILSFPNVTLTGAGALTCENVNISSGQNYQINGSQIATTNLSDVTYTGAWTCGISASGTAGTPAYSTQYGTYTKIGKFIYCQFNLVITGWTGSPAGNVTITGLPFSSQNVTNLDYGGCYCQYYSLAGSLGSLTYGITGFIGQNSTVISLYQGGNSSTTPVTAADIGNGQVQILGCAFYHT